MAVFDDWEYKWAWPPWDIKSGPAVLTEEEWAVHWTNTLSNEFLRDLVDLYLRTDAATGELAPDGQILVVGNYASPRNLDPLIRDMAKWTDQIRTRLADEESAFLALAFVLPFRTGECEVFYSTLTWTEFRWSERFAQILMYHQAAMNFGDPDAAGLENPMYWNHVVRPLLLGLPALTDAEHAEWKETGVDPKPRTVPYVVEPYTLWMLTNLTEAEAEANSRLLARDLKDRTIKTAVAAGEAAKAGLYGVLGPLFGVGVVAVAAAYAYNKGRA